MVCTIHTLLTLEPDHFHKIFCFHSKVNRPASTKASPTAMRIITTSQHSSGGLRNSHLAFSLKLQKLLSVFVDDNSLVHVNHVRLTTNRQLLLVCCELQSSCDVIPVLTCHYEATPSITKLNSFMVP
uniref:Uncharacterized protein n=1 Tax=Rhipicephalus microplus TaxID=6941 RepID=A0A6G5A173_RHIMP